MGHLAPNETEDPLDDLRSQPDYLHRVNLFRGPRAQIIGETTGRPGRRAVGQKDALSSPARISISDARGTHFTLACPRVVENTAS